MNKKAKILLESLLFAPSGLICEIGCIREGKEVPEDGFSTYYLAEFAKHNRRPFKSYDICEENVNIANKVLRESNLPESVYVADGKVILPTLGPISFLFLDAHRIPAISFEQYQAAELASNAIVVIDDAQFMDGNQYGKATYCVLVFMKNGIKWEIKNTEPGFKMVIAYFPNGKKSGALY